MTSIYFDHNATTPLMRAATQAMDALGHLPLNPSSIHAYGRQARQYIEKARHAILHAIGAEDMRLIFTATGSEANHLALRGTHATHLLVSAIEHPSVLKAAMDPVYIPVTAEGTVNLHALEHQLEAIGMQPPGSILISVMYANNETGIIQPLADIVRLAHHYGAVVHTDAVQAFGKIPLHILSLGVDMVTISAHKCGGPPGAAALIIKKSMLLHPQIVGGGQEQGYRAGTENVRAIVGFGAVAEVVYTNKDSASSLIALRDRLETGLQALVPQSIIIGQHSKRLPNTSCVVMPGVSSETQLIEFDLKSFALSAGSACSSGKISVSHVLKAMEVPDHDAHCAVRISLGPSNRSEEIDQFIKVWATLYQRMQA